MKYAVNRYSGSRKPGFHATIEASSAYEALKLSGLSTRGFTVVVDHPPTGKLELEGSHGSEIWIRPAVPWAAVKRLPMDCNPSNPKPATD